MSSAALIRTVLQGGGALMRIGLVVAAICLSFVGLSAADDAKALVRKDTSIPAGGLGPALQTLAKEYDFQVLYRTEVVGALRTEGAVGQFTSEEALKQLLKGTELTYRYLDEKTITIVPANAAPSGTGSAPTSSSSSPQTSSGDQKEGKTTAFGETSSAMPGVLLAQAAQRQAPGPAGAAQSSTNAARPEELQEIVVTAQKREERLIDVPQSVTVLSASDLARLGATQFSDFANTIPGMSYQTAGAGFTSVTLRGITTGYDISPTVGVYVDDVPYGASTTFVQAAQTALDVGLFDLERIEVLRGPQGTLYGASTMGGLLKYVTNAPDPSGFSGSARVGVSDTANGGVNYYGAATINMPTLTNQAVRLSGFESHDAGYIDNVGLNVNDANEGDIYGGRLDYLFKMAGALSVRVTFFAQDISRDGETTADYTRAGQPYGSLGQNRVLPEPFTGRFRLGSATVAYDFAAATLTSITSYQTDYEHNVYDVSAIYVPIFQSIGLPYTKLGLPSTQNTDKVTQEIRLASRSTGSFEWLVGGFYTHEDSYIAQYFVDQTGTPTPTITTLPQPSIYEEYAGFGDLTWHLAKEFDVTGGVRVAHNDQTFSEPPNPGSVRSSETVTTYLANARYHFGDHSTAYVRYATGYRPGGPNYRLKDPVTGVLAGPPAFDADKLQSYEGGFKAETSDGRFGFDFATYYIDWNNIQVLAIQDGLAYRTNAPGGATVKGAELTLTARPVDDLLLSGAFAYQDAYLKEAVPALSAPAGERLPAVPRWTAAVNADWVILHNDLQPSVGATYRYVDHRLASLSPPAGFTELYTLPSYSTLDVRLAATFGSVNAQFYVHNLTDEHGQVSNLYPQFGARIAILQPRTVGMLATLKF
jgi:iron complex outermembrane recepter protein